MEEGLYANEIIRILRKADHDINGVYSRDKLPKILDLGWYILNMQGEKQGDRHGTHWVAFKVFPQALCYFDAFGFGPPKEVMEHAEKSFSRLFYSTKEIQDYKSSACGFFCIGAIVFDKGYGLPSELFNNYINRFSENTKLNDFILKMLLREKNIYIS